MALLTPGAGRTPLAVDLDQGEEVGEAVAGPVVEFDAHRSRAAFDIDPDIAGDQVGGWAIFGVPVIEHLDRSGEQLRTYVTADGGQFVEDRAQSIDVAGLAALDVGLHDPADLLGVIRARGIAHSGLLGALRDGLSGRLYGPHCTAHTRYAQSIPGDGSKSPKRSHYYCTGSMVNP
jgi:hypothetical protein